MDIKGLPQKFIRLHRYISLGHICVKNVENVYRRSLCDSFVVPLNVNVEETSSHYKNIEETSSHCMYIVSLNSWAKFHPNRTSTFCFCFSLAICPQPLYNQYTTLQIKRCQWRKKNFNKKRRWCKKNYGGLDCRLSTPGGCATLQGFTPQPH